MFLNRSWKVFLRNVITLRCCFLKPRLSALLLMMSLNLWAQYRIYLSFDSGSTELKHSLGELSRETVRDFTILCSKNGADVILFDPYIFESILHKKNVQNSKCKFLCIEQPFVTFAVMEKSWRDSVLNDLRSIGFQWLVLTAEDPRLLPNNVQNIAVHFLFWRNKYAIHLVLLLERPGQFLWYSQALFTPLQKQWLLNVNFNATKLALGRFDGALPMFQISQVKIDGVSMLAPKFPRQLSHGLKHSRFIECNFSFAKSFHEKYPRDNSFEANTFRSQARDLITKVKPVLDDMKIPFWLSSGTLLGWYRQCDIIPYSADVDIGIKIEHYNQSLITTLERKGWHLQYKFGEVSDSFQIAFRLDRVKLDIYFFYTEGEFMWNGGTHARTGKKYKYLFPRFELCWTYFLDLLLRVPCSTESYIEANYGKEWRTPEKQWSWRENPSNILENGAWPKSEWDDVIQLFD